MRVEIASDVVCPWCYIGKRRFEAAVRQLADQGRVLDIEVRYRAFILDPSAPIDEVQPVRDAYARRFGGAEKAAEILRSVTHVAANEGLELRMDQALRANTVRAHRLLKIVEREAPRLQASINEAIMRAYFLEGLNINDTTVLVALATQHGFDSHELALELADDSPSSESARAVQSDLEWVSQHDITAVPTFVINDSFAIPGAQDASTFARLLGRFQ